MSKEILDAIGVVAYEKGIDPEILFTALEDALLAAYRKTPHAKPFARLQFDRDTGDIRLFTTLLTAEAPRGPPGVPYPGAARPADGTRSQRQGRHHAHHQQAAKGHRDHHCE